VFPFKGRKEVGKVPPPSPIAVQEALEAVTEEDAEWLLEQTQYPRQGKA